MTCHQSWMSMSSLQPFCYPPFKPQHIDTFFSFACRGGELTGRGSRGVGVVCGHQSNLDWPLLTARGRLAPPARKPGLCPGSPPPRPWPPPPAAGRPPLPGPPPPPQLWLPPQAAGGPPLRGPPPPPAPRPLHLLPWTAPTPPPSVHRSPLRIANVSLSGQRYIYCLIMLVRH